MPHDVNEVRLLHVRLTRRSRALAQSLMNTTKLPYAADVNSSFCPNDR